MDVPGSYEGIIEMAAARGGEEAGMSLALFFAEAKEKYDKGVYEFIWKPMVSFVELLDLELVRAALELDMFSGFSGHLHKFTTDPLMHMILKWPVIFIGADPEDAASMYSLMTYAGHVKGTWHVFPFFLVLILFCFGWFAPSVLGVRMPNVHQGLEIGLARVPVT